MKKRLGILLALSLLFVGIFVQAAAAKTVWNTSALSAADTVTVTNGVGGSATLTLSFTSSSESGSGVTQASGTLTIAVDKDGLTVGGLTAGDNTLTITETEAGVSYTYATSGLAANTTSPATKTATLSLSSTTNGTYTVTVAEPNKSLSKAITVTVQDPVKPGFKTNTTLNSVVVGTDNSQNPAATIQFNDADDTDNITIKDLAKAEAAVSKFGFTLDTTDLSTGIKLMTESTGSTKVGTMSFTLTPQDTNTKLVGEATTFTMEVTGQAPTIAFYNEADFSAAAPSGTDQTEEYKDNFAALYDSNNEVIYSGKEISLAKDQGSTACNFVFYAKGSNANSDLKVTAKIEPTGSGFTITKADAVDLTDRAALQSGVSITLGGNANKKGTYTLTITATNDELKRQGKDPVTQKYKFKIADSPSIPSTNGIVEWGKAFELKIKPENADTMTVINAAADIDTLGVWIGTGDAPTAPGNLAVASDKIVTSGAEASDTDLDIAWDSTSKVYTISGTWSPASGAEGKLDATAEAQPLTLLVVAQAGEGDGKVYNAKAVTLTFKAVAPTVTTDTDFSTIEYGEAKTGGDDGSDTDELIKVATAKGPGKMVWWDSDTALAALNDKLPAGLEIAKDATEASQGTTDTSTLYLMGTPREITSSTGTTVAFTVKNADDPDDLTTGVMGSTKYSPKVIVVATGTTEPDISLTAKKAEDQAELTMNDVPSGWAKVGDAFATIVDASDGQTAITIRDPQYTVINGITERDPAAVEGEVELFAEPGPLKWSASNLPSNVQLVVDKKDSRFAYLQFKETGGFKKATTIKTTTENGDKVYSSPYTITLTNPYLSSSTKTITGNLVVWEAPKVTTKSLADLTVNKSWTPSVAFSGTPTDYVVEYIGDSTYAYPGTGTTVESFKADGGEESVTFNTDTLKFSGTLDRIPKIKSDASTVTTPKAFKVKITPTNYALAYDDATSDNYGEFTVNVKGVAPAFASTSKVTLADGGEAKIETTKGTPDITLTAYVAKSDVVKFFNSTADTDTDLDDSTANYGFTFSQTAGDTYGTLAFNQPSGTTYAYKDLPITFVASNDEAKVTKVVKITVAGADPKWEATDGTYEESNGVITVVNGTAVDNVYTADITSPYEIKITPDAKNEASAKNGIYFTKTNNAIAFAGTTESTKATKTAFTMTATNLSTKQKAQKKITFDSLQKPEITSTADKLKKEVALGKKLTIKPTVKGTKGIKWRIADSSAVDEDTLAEYGLTVDTSKGGITGTAAKLTHSTGTYGTQKVTLEAYNETLDDAGFSGYEPTADFEFGIYGAKPKVTTKSITIKKGDTSRTTDSITVKTTPLYDSDDGGDTQYLQFTLANAPTGIEIGPSNGVINFTTTESSLEATKGTTAKVTVTNVEPGNNKATVTSNLKFIINDDTPSINAVEEETFDADASKKVTATLTAEVSDETCTGDTKIKWAITKAPSKSQAKIKANTSDNGKTATITITIPKNLTNDNDETINENITISATNQRTKDVGTKEITYHITPVSTATEATAEDATFDAVADKTADAKAEEKAATGEGEVKFGKTRTAPTAAQLGAVQKVLGDGYVIAAVLPEIEVTADGQYDFEVDLDEKVAAGAELVWFAFPESGKESEDDEIVDFYTKAGEDTKVVPEDHVLVVSPWLNAEVKYEPVIAVKVDAAEAEAVDAESVKEAAEEQAAE